MKIFELFPEPELDEGRYDPHTFKAIFMAGGPGSGKSFYAKKLVQGTGLKYIDLDDFFEYLKKTQNLKSPELAARSKELKTSKLNLAISGNLGLLIDGTGRRYDRIADSNEQLKSVGYETAMVFVNTDLDVAIERNKKRDRMVPVGWLTRAHKAVRDNIGKFQMLFGDRLFIIDNSDPNLRDQYDIVWKKVHQFLNVPSRGN